MASTDQELKTLNKTVTEAVNILKMYVGSSAQVKALSEKEREMLDKQLKIMAEEEEQQKKQRAFTERARDARGRFIKKREGAWGKMLDMTEATFRVLNKMSFGVLGKVKNVVMGIAQNFSRFFQELKSQFLSLFGEESEWFALLGAMKDGVVNATKNVWGFLFQKTPKWAGTQIKLLRKMLALQMKEWKLGFLNREVKPKEMGMAAVLGILIAALLKALSGWMGDRLATIFGLGGLAGLTKPFKKLGAAIQALKQSKWLKWIDDVPYLGKAMRLLGFGIKRLLLPLSILLSVIEFMDTWRKTEGDKWDKAREALWAVLDDWIELPLQIFLHLVNGIMKAFTGEEFDVSSMVDEIMTSLKQGWDFILTGSFVQPMMNFFKQVGNMFINLWNAALEKMASLAEGLPWGLGSGVAESLRASKGELYNMDYSTDKSSTQSAVALNAAEKARGIDVANIENRQATHGTTLAKLEEMRKQGEEMKKQSEENTYAARMRRGMGNFLGFGGGGQGDVKQVPDEIDNNIVGLNVFNGAMY
jgi:RNAse (barnase) inhibitor barstar